MRRRARTSATSPNATSAAPRPSSRSSAEIAEPEHVGRRAFVAAVIVILLTAGAVSAAGLLEIDRLQQIIKDPNVLGPLVVVDNPAPGKPQTIMALGTDG